MCNAMLAISRNFSLISNEAGSCWRVLNIGYIDYKYSKFSEFRVTEYSSLLKKSTELLKKGERF